ncbi:hypothetical protein [uncultured Aquimarina sp.]|uniref:hypothetical protein n=1 Tax=uncultured Aquimarina sp. TaxID=575652 RepID=UPI00260E1945|nr:hypothetical protein [uncultured Aquimarina sp.]
MNKIDVFDLLHRIEMMLSNTISPITNESIVKIINEEAISNADISLFQFTILPNGNFCEFEGANDWIHIYKETKRGFSKWNPITTYYFKSKYAPLELLKLSKANLLENVQNTPHELEVATFLTAYNISKRNSQGNLLLLGL